MEDTGGPHPIDLHVGQRLRLRRRQLGLSQGDLATALKMTFQQVQKYERGTNRISASKLFLAAHFLKVEPSYFFDGLPSPSSDEAPAPRASTPLDNTSFEIVDILPRLHRTSRRQILTQARHLLALTEGALEGQG